MRRLEVLIYVLEVEEVEDIANWLSTMNFRPMQTDNLAKRTPGTGKWLFADPDFKTWIEAEEVPAILWEKGMGAYLQSIF